MVCEQQRRRPPVHSRSLISALVIHLLSSIIYRLSKSKISAFWLVSVAELVESHFVGNPKDSFPRPARLNYERHVLVTLQTLRNEHKIWLIL